MALPTKVLIGQPTLLSRLNGWRGLLGDWKDDLQDGYGVEIWADGSKYSGHYKKTKKDGEGTYLWSDGSKYQGTWLDNK